MRLALAVLACFIPMSAYAGAADTISLGDATEKALQQSLLTLQGSQSFHLKATIGEKGEPGSDYQATLEEYWVNPTKWRRIISSPAFSQTLVVNGDAISETDTGDYFPFWLNGFVTALTEGMPAPMLEALKQAKSQIAVPHGSEETTTCANLPSRVDRWVICFEGSHGLFGSVFTKGYSANYKDYKKFGNKWIARTIFNDPEPGTTVEARINELTELTQPSEQMFQITQTTPPEQRIKSVRIDEDVIRKLSLGSTEIVWPTVGEGLLKGGCGVYISADRSGKVREALPEGCDNGALQDPLRQAVMKWRLKPAVVGGVPVQVEALLGFPFQTTLDSSKSLPELSDAEVRGLASGIVEPDFPPGSGAKGTEFIVQISVDETGKLTGTSNTHSVPGPVFFAADAAVSKWHFTPYIKDGKPQYFHADVVFHMK